MSKKKLSRRQFLSSAAAVGAFTIVPRHVLGGKNYTSPSSKVNIAGVGIGGMGGGNLHQLKSQNIVALCDVDHSAKKVLDQFNKYPSAKRYKDYREMLQQKDIDAVLIATPDHTHHPITIAAMKAGKHVFTQKPMAHTPVEAREMTRIAKETGVVTQMGIQGHSGEGIRRLCEWIWGGVIGEVEKVDAWCSHAYYPPGPWWCTTHYDTPKEKPPVPKGLDWDKWLGPAPYRDYHPTYHPSRWRAWYDFGCGMMGDRGVHTFDPIVTALKLKLPTSVSATVSNLNKQTHPISSIVNYYFESRDGGKNPFKVTWYEGIEAPRPVELEDRRRMYGQGGVVFKGSKASIMCGVYGNDPMVFPQGKDRSYKKMPKTLPRIKGSHEMEWINAIKENRKASADFEYSGPLTETVLLGNLAKRVRSVIRYDAENMKITNNDKANALMHKEYRTGW